jgi:hypothetical protein
MTAAAADCALAAYLAAASEAEAGAALGALLGDHAAPLVWKIVRRQLGGRAAGFEAADLEDLHAATLLKLQLHFVSIRAGEKEPPASLADYVAVAAFNAAASFLMAREPERTRLRDRVRYVLRRDARLAAWSGVDRELVCGLASAAGEAAGEGLGGRLAELAARGAAEGGAGWGQLPRLVATLLERLGAPCRFEELVDALAERLGIVDAAPLPLAATAEADEEGATPLDPADARPGAERRLDLRSRLATLWTEVAALPPNQRFALLANLRGESGEDLLGVLLEARVVGEEELAAALGLAAPEWAEVAPTLPRDDLWIAARLSLTRQQVINLRKSARLRLARRLRGVLPEVG